MYLEPSVVYTCTTGCSSTAGFYVSNDFRCTTTADASIGGQTAVCTSYCSTQANDCAVCNVSQSNCVIDSTTCVDVAGQPKLACTSPAPGFYVQLGVVVAIFAPSPQPTLVPNPVPSSSPTTVATPGPSAAPTPVPSPAPTHCPSGEIVQDGRCKPCESGRYASNITWSCELCEAGRFQTFSGRTSCDRCDPYEFSTENRVYCALKRPRWLNSDYQTGTLSTLDTKASWTFLSKLAQPILSFTTPQKFSKPDSPFDFSGAPCASGQHSADGECRDCTPGRYAPTAQTDECSIQRPGPLLTHETMLKPVARKALRN